MKFPSYTAAVIGVGKAGGGGPKGGGHAIGYTHATMFKSAAPRVRLVACADINAENLAAFEKKFDVPQGFERHEQMLREIKPDIVSIGTYVGLHREMIESAARAGVKGILCEKPFLPSMPACRAVEAIARETGVKIIVAHVRRYRPAFQRARTLFNDGTIGQPIMCVSGIADWDLSEWGSHWLDMFRFLNDDAPVQWVFGQARVGDFRGYGHAMEDHAVAYFEFANGCKRLLDGGKGMVGGGDMTLIGTGGKIHIRDESVVTIHDARGETVERFDQVPNNRWEDCWSAALNDLLAWIEGGPEPMLGLSNMLKTSELNLAAYLSALRGDRIELPLIDEMDEWPVEALARRRSAGAS